MAKHERHTWNQKREHVRYGIASLAEIIFPESGQVLDALVNSISRGGVGIYTQETLTVGRRVRIKISFLQTNGNQEVTEIIPGEIAWIKPLHKYFAVGIVFTALDADRHANLLRGIEAASGGKS
ncbi:MAG: PilZ domain-containing protein [Nitrospirae bacterium]|nr:PilZ domain-containing protein [Nitrospirota bacterium]